MPRKRASIPGLPEPDPMASVLDKPYFGDVFERDLIDPSSEPERKGWRTARSWATSYHEPNATRPGRKK